MNPVDLPAGGQASTTLTLTTSGDTTPGSYTITVEGISGDMVQQVSFDITIEPGFPDPKPGDPGDISTSPAYEYQSSWRRCASKQAGEKENG
jgi:hypothetical protein